MRSGNKYIVALHKSTNGGTSWETYKACNNEGVANAVAVNPDNDKTIYLGGYQKKNNKYLGALFKSTNGGKKFKEIGKKQFSQRWNYIGNIAVDPFSPDTVYVCNDNQLFKSTNAGSSWKEITSTASNFGLINHILLDPEVPDRVYVATRDGIQFSDDGGTQWAQINKGLMINDSHCLEIIPSNNYLFTGTDGAGVYRCSNKNLKTGDSQNNNSSE